MADGINVLLWLSGSSFRMECQVGSESSHRLRVEERDNPVRSATHLGKASKRFEFSKTFGIVAFVGLLFRLYGRVPLQR